MKFKGIKNLIPMPKRLATIAKKHDICNVLKIT